MSDTAAAEPRTELGGTFSHVTALASRSVRAEENKWLTHVLRGLVCLGILFFLYVTVSEAGASDAPGLAVFTVLVAIDGVAIGLAGVSLFPSVVTEEKEARTLGLLRMADVGPAAVLIGKSLPRLALVLALLLVQMPLTLLAVTLGGVTWEQVFACYFVLAVTAVTFCSFGALMSVLCKSTRQASSLMVALIILLPMIVGISVNIAGYFFGPWFLRYAGWILEEWLAPITPVTQLVNLLSGMSIAPGSMAYFVGTNAALCLVFYGLAYAWFDRRSTDDGPAADGRPVGLRGPEISLRRGRAEQAPPTPDRLSPDRVSMPRRKPPKVTGPKTRNSRRPWASALAWKDWWFVGGGRLGFLIRMLGYPLVAVAVTMIVLLDSPRSAAGYIDEIFGGSLASITGGCFFVELAVIASRLFRTELDNNTWASLVMLPQSVGRTIASKVGGALAVVVPTVACFLFGMSFHLDVVDDFFLEIGREPTFGLVVVYLVLLTVACSLMIAYLSLWMRYGMIPLTAVIVVAVHVFAIITLAAGGVGGDGTGVLLLGCFVQTVLSFVLVELIRDRLTVLAAMED